MDTTNTFPCKDLVPNWNWFNGDVFTDNTTSVTFTRNYFDCGIYMFDGTFNVVKFPAGMTLYHGSANLANGVAEFPVGLQYYTEFDMSDPTNNILIKQSKPELLSVAASSEETIETIISESIPITAGWYADPSVAFSYSAQGMVDPLKTICKGKCVNAYVLKKDITMMILDDDYNIAKLLLSPDSVVPENKKQELQAMFQLTSRTPLRTNSDNPFDRVRYPMKARKSVRAWDLPFAEWTCKNVVDLQGYAGYAATSQHSQAHGGKFHLEFIFCNAFKYLKRDLTNVHDWQVKRPATGVVGEFMNQLGLYESTNVDFHAGNLLQHSIWTLLFAEKILQTNEIQMNFSKNTEFVQHLSRFTAFCAFIHDIGKMSIDNVKVNNKRNKFIFFAIPDHPTIGANYIQEGIPIYDQDLNAKGTITYDQLVLGFNLPYATQSPWKEIAFAVLRLHWEFGDTLRRFNLTDKTEAQAMTFGMEFVEKALSVYSPPTGNSDSLTIIYSYIYILLVVSVADIRGALPYGKNRLKESSVTTIELNKSSSFFPMITNMPRKYRGGNVRKISDLDTTGITLANFILNSVLSQLTTK